MVIVLYGYDWFNGPDHKPDQKVTYSAADRDLAESGITIVDPSEIERWLGQQGRPRLLYIYASWCPYCREQTPVTTEIMRDYADKIDHRSLSFDREKLGLAHYLNNLEKPVLLDPVMASEETYSQIIALLHHHDIYYTGSIPFAVLFDENGKKVAEFNGVVDKASMQSAIETMLQDKEKRE